MQLEQAVGRTHGVALCMEWMGGLCMECKRVHAVGLQLIPHACSCPLPPPPHRPKRCKEAIDAGLALFQQQQYQVRASARPPPFPAALLARQHAPALYA